MTLDELQIVGTDRTGLRRDQPHDVFGAGRSGAAALVAEQTGVGGQQELEIVQGGFVEPDWTVSLGDGVLVPEFVLFDGSTGFISFGYLSLVDA